MVNAINSWDSSVGRGRREATAADATHLCVAVALAVRCRCTRRRGRHPRGPEVLGDIDGVYRDNTTQNIWVRCCRRVRSGCYRTVRSRSPP